MLLPAGTTLCDAALCSKPGQIMTKVHCNAYSKSLLLPQHVLVCLGDSAFCLQVLGLQFIVQHANTSQMRMTLLSVCLPLHATPSSQRPRLWTLLMHDGFGSGLSKPQVCLLSPIWQSNEQMDLTDSGRGFTHAVAYLTDAVEAKLAQ